MKPEELDNPKARFTQEELLGELESYFRRPNIIQPGDLTPTMIQNFYKINRAKTVLPKMEQVVAEHPEEWILVDVTYRNGRCGKVLRKIK
jgi:hypothetical protein